MPGELLTSKTKGPLLLLSMSTPATDKPRDLAALTATDLSFLDRIAFSAVPPWCISVSYTHLTLPTKRIV